MTGQKFVYAHVDRGVKSEKVKEALELLETAEIFYWGRRAKSSTAEIDYLTEKEGRIIPIEVKSGPTGRMKSLHIFIKKHQPKYVIFENGLTTIFPRKVWEPFRGWNNLSVSNNLSTGQQPKK